MTTPRLKCPLLLTTLALSLGTTCEDLTFTTDPPEILDAEVTCITDSAIVRIIVGGENAVTNVRIDLEDQESWFPIEDTPKLWAAEQPMDCDGSWDLTVTVTNALGIQSTTTLYWPQAEPELDALEPAVGSSAGGSPVTLRGDDLAQTEAVRFGGAPAELVAASDGALTLLTPAHAPGLVDVEIDGQGETLTLEGAFTYFEDHSGLVGGFAQPRLFVYDPAWFTIGSPYGDIGVAGPFLQMDMVINEPTEAENTYLGAMPTPGECAWGQQDYTAIVPTTYTLAITDAGTEYVLTPDNGWNYAVVQGGVTPEDWAGVVMDLELPQGDDVVPAQRLTDALAVPAMPTTAYDWQLANGQAFGEDLVLEWTDAGWDGVGFTVYAVASGFRVLDSAYCTAPGADESFTVAWDEITASFDPSSLSGFVVGARYWQDLYTPFVHDNSDLWSRGSVDVWSWHPIE